MENNLYEAILNGQQEMVISLLSDGANPNKTTSHGKTCLGAAACIGNVDYLKLLISSFSNNLIQNKSHPNCSAARKRHYRSYKRRRCSDGINGEIGKCKNFMEYRMLKDDYPQQGHDNGNKPESLVAVDITKNHGYFVFVHDDESSTDEGCVSLLTSPVTPTSPFMLSPQAELEWDEEVGNVAPSTSEDETWSSLYRWYAAILECTGAALASAAAVPSGIDQQDAFLRTALHYAAEQGHISAVRLLLDAGCKVDISTADGLTPLHVAITRNHGEVVKMLLDAGSHVNYKTHDKMTALHFAASRGFLELVKMLVNAGASLEARDTNERTALYLAAGRGHEDVIKYLISAGANVNGEEIHGYTPLCEAVWQRSTQIVRTLLTSGARVTHSHKLLHNAVIQRQEEIVRMLAVFGGGINLHNDNGDTPLLLACRLSQPQVVRILLEYGANVNASNSITGSNALHIAVESVDVPEEFEELLICLLEHKIDMNATALTDDTALNRAILLHRDHAVFLLVKYGSDVNVCDLQACALDNLTIASRRSSPNLARLLIKAGHELPSLDSFAVVPKAGSTANWLYYVCKTPLSLCDLCRIRIRSMRRDNMVFHQYIMSLYLPKILKRFLMLEDVGY